MVSPLISILLHRDSIHRCDIVSALEHIAYTPTFSTFYRAMLCMRGTSHGPVSVSVCVCVSHKSEFY